MAVKDFWSDIVTEKSWNVLLSLKKMPFEFILIGGWATYLWTKTHKSKDIDIVLTDFKALEYLKENHDLRKNEHLRKYEIKIGEIDVDIYVQFFSKLAIPPEDLKEYTTKLEGITVILPEALLVLKQAAEIDRRGSTKGEKDSIDIMTLLLNCDIDFARYRMLLDKYRLKSHVSELSGLIRSFDLKNIAYLGLNERTFKLKKVDLLKRLKESPTTTTSTSTSL